jgi:hypothetical protein
MNERVKELAKQAGYEYGSYDSFGLFEIEKFAELIVRECAETAASCFVGWPMNGSEQRHTCSNAIKKHFGVA